MARCKFCGQEIDWITSLEGKRVPVGPDPVFVIEGDSPEAFMDDMGATITGRMAGGGTPGPPRGLYPAIPADLPAGRQTDTTLGGIGGRYGEHKGKFPTGKAVPS